MNTATVDTATVDQSQASRASPAKVWEDFGRPLGPQKRRREQLKKEVDLMLDYTPEQAIAFMKKYAWAEFDETAEFHGNLNLQPKYNDQQIRTTVSLPHGSGKEVRVAVLAE